MATKVFIDGEAGTTGLQIRHRLQRRDDITLLSLEHTIRKRVDARLDAFREADISILCLPDNAVLEIVPKLVDCQTRIIDASTAHRVHPDWAFGFPELSEPFRTAIQSSKRVSNPGCYSTGAIALLYPLTMAGIIAPGAPISINAVSGYSGGGRAMVDEYASGSIAGTFFYGMDQRHKHIPEIMKYGGLTKRPVFVPSVGQFEQGMIVQIPLPFLEDSQGDLIRETLAAHYRGSNFVHVIDCAAYGKRIDPCVPNHINRLELSVHHAPDGECIVLVAILDNLGKGASGAAVQNLNIMLGLDETAYL